MTRVAHLGIVTPGRCGLYETMRELVAAEREQGIDARIVDPKPHPIFAPKTKEDRGVPIADMEWATGADLLISHSGHDGTPVSRTNQPILVAAHGRPVASFIGERAGGTPVYTYHATRSKADRYIGCITFWPEYIPYFKGLWGDKPVYHVPSTVDTDCWCPGATSYNFAGKKAEVNVVMTDPWSRADVTLLPSIHAFEQFRKLNPGARLHIYALDGNRKGLDAIKLMLGDSLGVVQGWASDLRSVYRAADLLLTPHRIYTRSIREAMACDVPVVSGKDVNPEQIGTVARLMSATVGTHGWRKRALKEFDTRSAGAAMAKIIMEHSLDKVAA